MRASILHAPLPHHDVALTEHGVLIIVLRLCVVMPGLALSFRVLRCASALRNEPLANCLACDWRLRQGHTLRATACALCGIV